MLFRQKYLKENKFIAEMLYCSLISHPLAQAHQLFSQEGKIRAGFTRKIQFNHSFTTWEEIYAKRINCLFVMTKFGRNMLLQCHNVLKILHKMNK